MALLLLTLVVTASGWANYSDLGGDWMEDVHETLANIMLAVIGVHIAGVLLGSWLHRENLVRAMITGRKPGQPAQGARRAWRGLAALLLIAVLGFWAFEWQAAPAPQAAVSGTAGAAHGHGDD